MPSFRTAEASEGPVCEAERGNGRRREASGEAQAKGPADLRPASVPDPNQSCGDRSSKREEEGTHDAAEQSRPTEARAVPQREAPKGTGRCGGEQGDCCQGTVHEHAKEGARPDAGGRQEERGGVRGLFQAAEAEFGVPRGAEQVHVSTDESEDREEG